MDARSTVTAKEGDRYPLRPPVISGQKDDTFALLLSGAYTDPGA